MSLVGIGILGGPTALSRTLTVHVTAQGDSEVSDTYVAIAAENGSWRTPLRELIVDERTTTFDLPPGSYSILAGAPTFNTALSKTVIADSDTTMSIVLAPLSPVQGYVVDSAGQPIPGPRITRLGAPALSTKGGQFLKINTEITADEKGTFKLFVPADEDVRYIAEAPGYQPEVFEITQPLAVRDQVVRLEPGAVLRARWNEPPAPQHELISLLPIDVTLPPALTREQAVARWTQAVNGTGQAWPSLFPGTYHVVLRSGSVDVEHQTPVELGEVVLSPHDDRTLSLNVRASEPAQSEDTILIRVLVPDVSIDTELTLSVWHQGRQTKIAPGITPSTAGPILSFRMPETGNRIVVVESPTRLGSARIDTAPTETVRIPLSEKAYVAARFTTRKRQPYWGSLSLCEGKPEKREIPFASVDGDVRITVPTGCADGILRVAGFIPRRQALPALRQGQHHDLGTVNLQQGAAAVLRVLRRHDGEPMQNIRVTAVRAQELREQHEGWQLAALALSEGTTDRTGWARLVGLPPEDLFFVLTTPGRKVPQISEPFRLPLNEETVIDSLLLDSPSRVFVNISVTPRVEDSLQLHRVELTPTGHNHWPARAPLHAQIASHSALIDDVPPGTWTVRATGRLENGFAIQVGRAMVDVERGGEHYVTLDVADLLYDGRVTRDGLPVPGTINLRPAEPRSTARGAVAKIGPDGGFVVLLEEKGSYVVTVQHKSRGGSRLGDPVSFDDPEDEVLIALPTGKVHGRVLDEQRSAVTGVSVTATEQLVPAPATVFARTSSDGLFDLEGMTAGTWQIIAQSAGHRSEPVIIAFDREDVEGVSLVVEATRDIAIRVVDSTGLPLRDTLVIAQFPVRDRAEPTEYLRTTRANGETVFHFSKAEQASLANLVIKRRDGSLSCARRILDRDHVLTLPAQWGEVHLIRQEWKTHAGEQKWLVSREGCAVPFLPTVQRTGTDQAMVFPRLPVGQWSYVTTRTPGELAAVLSGAIPRGRANVTFRVDSGKTTRVLFGAAK